jgi:hypothetical protein
LLHAFSGSFAEFNSGEILTAGESAGDFVLAVQGCSMSYEWFPAVTTVRLISLDIMENKPATKNLLSISPNPFNSTCKINAPEGSIIKIYDINGKLVACPTNNRWQPSTSGGIYFVRCDYNGQTTVKRVAYLK